MNLAPLSNQNSTEKVEVKVSIYTLADPRTDQVRYVGKTIHLIEKRLKGHLRDEGSNHRNNWIKSLKKLGLKPRVELLEQVSHLDWKEAEQFYIEYFRQLGFRLVNSTAGGEGLLRACPETRAKISFASKNISNETRSLMVETALNQSKDKRAAISATLKAWPGREEFYKGLSKRFKGRKISEEWRENLRRGHLGQKQKPESIAKMLATKKANGTHMPSPQNRIACIAALKAKWQDPEFRAMMKKHCSAGGKKVSEMKRQEATAV